MLDIKLFGYDGKLIYQAVITEENMQQVCGAIQMAVCKYDEPTRRLVDNLREINSLLGIDNMELATRNTSLEAKLDGYKGE